MTAGRQILRVLLYCAILSTAPGLASDSLYDQSLAQIAQRSILPPNLSYILMNARTGRIISRRWEDPDRAVALGSLVKPFTALSYGARTAFEYPVQTCRGSLDGCWLPQGHGRIGIDQAIAYSCNAYFNSIAAQMSATEVPDVARRFGLRLAGEPASSRSLVGLGNGYRSAPEEMLSAYCELARHRGEPGVDDILRGLFLSAQVGTARAVGQALPGLAFLTKTGTGPCTHPARSRGDGYVIALYPADDVGFALMVEMHGAPGSHAATAAVLLLRRLIGGTGRM